MTLIYIYILYQNNLLFHIGTSHLPTRHLSPSVVFCFFPSPPTCGSSRTGSVQPPPHHPSANLSRRRPPAPDPTLRPPSRPRRPVSRRHPPRPPVLLLPILVATAPGHTPASPSSSSSSSSSHQGRTRSPSQRPPPPPALIGDALHDQWWTMRASSGGGAMLP
jgi:hypothetical protein